MPDKTLLNIHVSLALKQASKGLRDRFKDKDWMVREAAEHELAGIIEAAIERAFEVEPRAVEIANRYPGNCH